MYLLQHKQSLLFLAAGGGGGDDDDNAQASKQAMHHHNYSTSRTCDWGFKECSRKYEIFVARAGHNIQRSFDAEKAERWSSKISNTADTNNICSKKERACTNAIHQTSVFPGGQVAITVINTKIPLERSSLF
jgi:hypothetical protein